MKRLKNKQNINLMFLKLMILSVFVSLSFSLFGIDIGSAYDYVYTDPPVCPEQEEKTAFLPDYIDHQIEVQYQLGIMRNTHNLNILRVFARWGNNHSAAAKGSYTGALIDPPQNTLPVNWLTNLQLFLEDVDSVGFDKIILVLSGVGAYSFECGRDLDGLVNPTFKNALDQIMSVIQQSGNNNVIVSLGNEIAPSNYSSQCSIDAKTYVIKEIWEYYVDNYGVENVTFSAILDKHPDFHIAGNRLDNLIKAIKSVGKGHPSVFDVHAYGTQPEVVQQLRGVYQIYSDHGFLSNQANPKETIIGEVYYNDLGSAKGIKDYLENYDGYNGGKIGLSGVIEWPIKLPRGCEHVANVEPPYIASIYQFFLQGF